jgi:hypothetical protein
VKVFIRERSWIAAIAAKKLGTEKLAIVIGDTIHLTRTSRSEFLADRRWVCHELKHIAQFRRYGFARFIILYLIESARNGYYNNRYEKEARAAEKDASIIQKVQFTG